MKTIKLYEAFSGMGAQTKALKNISTNMHFELINLGACDFYIDAIVAYISINYGLINKEIALSKEQMIEILEKFPFSANSKNIVNKNYFKNINEEKLRKLFPYLYSFVNVKYLKTKLKTSGGGIRLFKFY
ncbi:MAG: DNA (cytosine-5-)-methyltransferase N-terminal subunit [Metamycoplasmataceae bacterium]